MQARVKKEIFDLIKVIIVGVLIGLVIRGLFFEITRVDGDSMNPTLQSEDKVLVNKFKPMIQDGKLKRGDTIVFEAPAEDKYYIKRVIGVSGDAVRFEKGKILVNGEIIEENYIQEGIGTYFEPEYADIPVEENRLFVVGDNRLPEGSYDSRKFGTISVESVRGKALIRIFPINKFGKF